MVSGQLIYPLCKVIEAFTSDRCIMICCDDMQWADSTSLSFISDVLITIGGLQHTNRRCLFVGLFRHEEIDDDHPLSIQRSYLQMSSLINTTEIKLFSLSKDDVVEMAMVVLRLPWRIVAELADLVYKKTSGHAIYVVELFHSLLSESIVTYSSQRQRYVWDLDRIDFIQTHANVAELIAANLTSLPPDAMSVLQVLSCFGIQTDMPLLQVLSDFQEDMLSLDDFVEKGILDRAGPIVLFTHDLILQAVYEGMPQNRRESLHLELGEYLGARASELSSMEPLTSITSHQKAFFAGSQLTSSLVSLACDQINFCRVNFIQDLNQKVKFAHWNFVAGQTMGHVSNFCAARYYSTKGISFLGKDCWQVSIWLSAGLHELAVMAAFALGDFEMIAQYSNEFIEHVPFEETLGVQLIAIKSLVLENKFNEAIMRVFGILARKRIVMPIGSLTEDDIMNVMATTDKVASEFSTDQIINKCEKFSDETVHSTIKICKHFFDFFFYAGSYYFPLLLFETVKYSLQNGVCHESASVFAVYGGLKIIYNNDFAGGKRWADASRAILTNYQTVKNAKIFHSYIGHRALATLVRQ